MQRAAWIFIAGWCVLSISGQTNASLDKGFGAWGPWSACSTKCTQKRVRFCIETCANARRDQTRYCQGGSCRRATVLRSSGESTFSDSHSVFFTPWSSWSACSSSCKRERYRRCRDEETCDQLSSIAGRKRLETHFKQTENCTSHGLDCTQPMPDTKEHKGVREDKEIDPTVLDTMAEAVTDLGISCGSRKVVPSLRIVGGKTAKRGDWPWQVAIIHRRSRMDRENYSDFPYYTKNSGPLFTPLGEEERGEDLIQYCGGTLIAPTWVLTAAHCVLENESTKKLKKKLAVVIGESDLRALRDPDVAAKRRFEIEKIYWHDDFDWDKVDSDLALIKLTEPVNADGFLVGYSCIPSKNLQLKIPKDEADRPLCYILGWGKTKSASRRSSSARLQYADVPLVPHKTCKKAFSMGITKNQLCAGWADGHSDSCDGDSGGPLMCQVQVGAGDDPRWIVYGVTSFGPNDGCGVAGKYGVYVKVSNYIDWISQRVLDGNSSVTFPSHMFPSSDSPVMNFQ